MTGNAPSRARPSSAGSVGEGVVHFKALGLVKNAGLQGLHTPAVILHEDVKAMQSNHVKSYKQALTLIYSKLAEG